MELSGGVRSLDSALHHFTAKETLDAGNRWRCGGCQKLVRAEKRLTVFKVKWKRLRGGGGYRGRRESEREGGRGGTNRCLPYSFVPRITPDRGSVRASARELYILAPLPYFGTAGADVAPCFFPTFSVEPVSLCVDVSETNY